MHMLNNEELIRRLFDLAVMAVDSALDYEYDDPEDYHIYRELQELKPLVARALPSARCQPPDAAPCAL